MKSPSGITTITNESSTELSSATGQVSKSKSPNLTLTNNNKVVISRTQKHIKEFSNEINIQSTNEMNTSIESTSMKSLNKYGILVKNNPQIITYDHNNNNIFSANLLLKNYDPIMYHNFDPCLGDNNNIKTYVRRSITLNIRVEDSNKIESINLSTSKFVYK